MRRYLARYRRNSESFSRCGWTLIVLQNSIKNTNLHAARCATTWQKYETHAVRKKHDDVFMCFAWSFQSVGAKTLNESNTFEQILKPQNKFESCMCVRKLEIWFWCMSGWHIWFLCFSLKIANVHETFTRDTFSDTHKMTTSTIHCLVKLLMVVFRNQ